MSKGTIVLAHGLFGFGDLIPLFQPVHYFNGVEPFLRSQDWNVVVPNVDPVGSVKKRAGQLMDQVPATALQPLHIIAHSLGGLDARYALSTNGDFAKQVTTLVMIGTPHLGSPVADAIADHTGPLVSELPDFLSRALKNTDAIKDLTSRACDERNTTTSDATNVEYINIAGNAALANKQFVYFELAARIRELTHEDNDGMVTKSSALARGYRQLNDWPVDHVGEVGWSFAYPAPITAEQIKLNMLLPTAARNHLARYGTILGQLKTGS